MYRYTHIRTCFYGFYGMFFGLGVYLWQVMITYKADPRVHGAQPKPQSLNSLMYDFGFRVVGIRV